MKKLILTMMFILLTLGQVWAVSPFRIKRLVGEYRHKDGFELVSIGPLGVGLLKHAVTRYGDLDKSDRKALASFKGVKGLIVLDFGDAPAKEKELFSAKMEKILSGEELIMEAKDDGERFYIYGTEKDGKLKDCILLSPGDAFVYVRGSISLEDLMKMNL